LGNSLRRVLLSSIPGAAITSIKIDGVFHEFSTIEHIREDVTQIILNVKAIRVRWMTSSDHPVRLYLSAQGEGVVTAGDIEVPTGVEIVNKNQPILTLDSPDARIDMELVVERGKGYMPAEMREGLPIGTIPVDAIFSPVKKVNFVAEHTRIGQVTTFDRLVLEIWTDGTIHPDEALSQSAEILVRYFSLLAERGRGPAHVEKQPLGAVIPPRVYETPIEELELSVRAYNCLKRAGITKVGQILEMSEEELLAVRNFGRKSLDELRERLIARGFIQPAGGGSSAASEGEEQA
jgi:DNA-directed RNA polymerase subunit alpha